VDFIKLSVDKEKLDNIYVWGYWLLVETKINNLTPKFLTVKLNQNWFYDEVDLSFILCEEYQGSSTL